MGLHVCLHLSPSIVECVFSFIVGPFLVVEWVCGLDFRCLPLMDLAVCLASRLFSVLDLLSNELHFCHRCKLRGIDFIQLTLGLGALIFDSGFMLSALRLLVGVVTGGDGLCCRRFRY